MCRLTDVRKCIKCHLSSSTGLREVSRIESDADPVPENIEEEETEQIANVLDMAESIGTEH